MQKEDLTGQTIPKTDINEQESAKIIHNKLAGCSASGIIMEAA